jgi:hypothetical protein
MGAHMTTSDGKVRRWTSDRDGNMEIDDRDMSIEAVRQDSYVLASDYGALLAERDATVAMLRNDLEYERIRLAAVGVVAMQNTPASVSERITRDNKYWSASYGDVCRSVDSEIALRADNARLRKWIKEKGRHHIACMMLDQYDTGEPYCTCGLSAALALGGEGK